MLKLTKAPAGAPAAAPAAKSSSGFASEAVFSAIEKSLAALGSSQRAATVKKTNAVFAFEITKDGKKQSWFVDLKNGEGSIGTGAGPKADMTVLVADKDFIDLASGKLNSQKAFMTGKIKIKGNMGLATYLYF